MIYNVQRHALNVRKREMSAHHKIWITILIGKMGVKRKKTEHVNTAISHRVVILPS